MRSAPSTTSWSPSPVGAGEELNAHSSSPACGGWGPRSGGGGAATGLGLASVLTLLATPALAHPGHPGHEALGFMAGLTHPLTGADHMLAMLAVGLWAALRGGKATWAWPAAFLVALLGGFALARLGLSVPLVEPAILASIIALGALTAANARVPTLAGVALIAMFGAAHGYAHGGEVEGATERFAFGMTLTTAALHGVGLLAGLGLQRLRQPVLVRLLGAGALVGGLALAVTG